MANGHDTVRLSGSLAGAEKIFLGAGVVGAIGCIASFFMDKKGFFASYLTAFGFFLALSLGAVFFVMVQHLARSSWSVTLRRIAESSAANLQWMVVFAIPLLLLAPAIYKWMDPAVVAQDHLLQAKKAWLNPTAFYIRNAIYFAAWFLTARYFWRMSVQQDASKDPALTLKMGKWSCLGLAVFGFSLTFWALDWIMALDPHWFSTMFGVYFFAGAVVAQYCFLILMAAWSRRGQGVKAFINVEHFHDAGKLLFGHNIFWTYIGFSQFMLIWYANIPEETLFFLHRAEGGWKTVSLLLPWCHFAIPFLFLMSHNIKRKVPLLAIGSAWLIIMCYIDIYWLVQPNFHHHVHFGLSDVSSILAIGGFFLYLFVARLKKVSLIPVGDPRLTECLSYDNGVVK